MKTAEGVIEFAVPQVSDTVQQLEKASKQSADESLEKLRQLLS